MEWVRSSTIGKGICTCLPFSFYPGPGFDGIDALYEECVLIMQAVIRFSFPQFDGLSAGLGTNPDRALARALVIP